MAYSDQQINDFLALAQEVGITKAKRELGYPKSWGTAQYWAKNRDVKVAVDDVMANAKALDEWYKDEEVLVTAQEGISRVYQDLTTKTDLTPDDQKKLSEAFVKHYTVWANIQGKATSISETRSTDAFDGQIEELLRIERAKNLAKKELVSPDVS